MSTDTEPTTTSADADPEERPERRRPRTWLETPPRVVIIYAVAFVIAEIVGTYVGENWQAVLDALFAFVAMNQAVFAYRTKRTAGLVMSALFTSRVMAITLPFTGVSLTTRTAIVGATTILVCYIAAFVLSHDVADGRSDEGFPLKAPFVSRNVTTLLTVCSGVPIGLIAFYLLDPPALRISPLWGSQAIPWLFASGALLLGALAEELLYRRLIAAAVQHTGQSQTPWISAVVFGATYLGTKNLWFVLLMVLTGAFFAWSCERTGSLKGVVAAHFIASVIVFLLLP